MFLENGRKPELLEETHTDTRRQTFTQNCTPPPYLGDRTQDLVCVSRTQSWTVYRVGSSCAARKPKQTQGRTCKLHKKCKIGLNGSPYVQKRLVHETFVFPRQTETDGLNSAPSAITVQVFELCFVYTPRGSVFSRPAIHRS